MPNLIAFLLTRLEEDERIAWAACFGRGNPVTEPEHWRWECTEDDAPIDVDLAIASGQEVLVHGEHWGAGLRSIEAYPTSYVGDLEHLILGAEEVRPQDARHIIWHDPARVLREVAVKRAILAEHSSLTSDACYACEGGARRCRTLALLAAIYSDHKDYQLEWKVSIDA